ncbi:8974_t:CDS:2, partial [Racocetra persica]
VGPIISITDPLHAKKDAQNALFSENNNDEILNDINSNQENLDDIINIKNLFISIATTEINKND